MILDFPDAKHKIRELIASLLKQRVKEKTPILGLASQRTLFEGNKMGVYYIGGEHSVSLFKKISSEISYSREEFNKMNAVEFIGGLEHMADEIASQMEQNALETIDKAVEAVGNVIEEPLELTPYSILKALEKISISFANDDRSMPNTPTIFAGSDTIQKLRLKLQQLSEVELAELQKKNDEILDQKYIEYMHDINSRKIVD